MQLDLHTVRIQHRKNIQTSLFSLRILPAQRKHTAILLGKPIQQQGRNPFHTVVRPHIQNGVRPAPDPQKSQTPPQQTPPDAAAAEKTVPIQ